MSFLNIGPLGSSSYFYNYSGVVPYANAPTNYLGSALFLAYILAAVVITGWILVDLYLRYNTLLAASPAPSTTQDVEPQKTEIKNARARHIKIYAGLASISFAILSYHMLNFLISSYVQWNASGLMSGSALNLENLKQWMLESSFFESFAMELVDDGPSTVWMQLGVLGTWFWGVWMSGKENERGFSKNAMMPYILLSQILPISFTALLFLIHLHLASTDIMPRSPAKVGVASTEADLLPLQPCPRKTSLLLPTILLNAVLLSLAPLRHHRLFLPLALFTRILLLLPFSGRISTRAVEVERCMIVSGGFIVANLLVLRKGYGLGDVVSVLKGDQFGGGAVRALAWDAVMASVVGRVLGWGGGV